MKKFTLLILAFMLFSIQLLAQTPVYLTKAYKPIESERYTAEKTNYRMHTALKGGVRIS